jgi:MFS family permease
LVAGLIATDAFMSLTRASSYPFLAIYLARQFELDAARIGLLLGAGPIFGMLVGLLGGAWSDRVGRWPLLLAAVAGSAVGFLGLSLANEVWQIFILNLLISGAHAVREPVVRALISDQADETRRFIAFNHRYVAINAAFALGPLLGALAAATHMAGLLTASGAGQIAIFLIFGWMARRARRARVPTAGRQGADPSTGHSILRTLTMIARDRRLTWFVLGAVLTATVHGQISVTLVQHLSAATPDGATLFALLMTVNAITVVLLSPPLSRVVKALSPFQAVALGALATAAGVFAFGMTMGHAALIGAMIVFSIGEVLIIPAEFLLVDGIAPEAQRGAYHGAMGFAALGSAIGPALGGGLLVSFGGAVAFAAFAGIALLAVVAFGRGRMAPPPASAGARMTGQSENDAQQRRAPGGSLRPEEGLLDPAALFRLFVGRRLRMPA